MTIEKERVDKAKRALNVFRGLQPTLTTYARMLTGKPNVKVVAAAHDNGSTDGTNIYYRPPIELGENLDHKRWLCDKREDTGQLKCRACEQREMVLSTVYHEIAHIWFDSFASTSDKFKTEALERAIEENGSRYATALKARIASAPYHIRDSYMGLAGLISQFLPILINCLEDARVNRELFRALPGTEIMFAAKAQRVFTEGVEQEDPETHEWKKIVWYEYPLNLQVMVGLFCQASGYDYSTWFKPRVIEALSDARITDLVAKTDTAHGMEDIYEVSFPILARLRELGFCKLPDDPDPEPESQSDESDEGAPSEDEDEDGQGGSDNPDSDPDNPDNSDSGDPMPDGGDSGETGEEEREAGDSKEETGEGDGTSDTPEDGTPNDESDTERGDTDRDPTGDDSSGDEGDSESESTDGSGSDSEGPGGDSDRDERQGDPDDSPNAEEPDGEPEPPEAGGDLNEGSEGQSGADTAADDDAGSAGRDEELDGDGDSGTGSPDLGPGGSEMEKDLPADASAGSSGDGADGDSDADDPVDGGEFPDEGGADLDPDESDSSGSGFVPDSDGRAGETLGDDADKSELVDTGAFGRATRVVVEESDKSDEPAVDEPLSSEPDEEMGTAEECRVAILKWGGHEDAPEEVTVHDHGHDHRGGDADDKAAMNMVIIQGVYFEQPSEDVYGVKEYRYPDGASLSERRRMGSDDWVLGGAWSGRDYSMFEDAGYRFGGAKDFEDFSPEESTLGPALLAARKTFADNARAKYVNGLKSGKVSPKVLGKRAPLADPRLMRKKLRPGKKSFFVLIGIDVSGSTMGVNIDLAKRVSMAEAELCSRLGIPFAVYAHSGSRFQEMNYKAALTIYMVKEPHEPWNEKTKVRLRDLGPDSMNLDGHTVEYYRKILDARPEQTKILHYYSDGAMPCENYDEELQILEREIKTCRRKGYILIGVGIRTDAPKQHGLDTVEVHNPEDVAKVVKHLEKYLVAS